MSTFDIINPATSAVLDRATDAGPDEARQAVDRSVAAFAVWKAKTAVRALDGPAQVVRADPRRTQTRSRA